MRKAASKRGLKTGPAVETSRPARERVYAHVCKQILTGHFQGGSFIEEEQISSVMNVSRTPVREAFHRLEVEKFIDLLPRRGALVRQVTASELSEVYEARRVVEGYSIARICQEGLPVPAELATLLEKMRRLHSNHYEHVLTDRMFHRTIVAASGNAILAEVYDSLRSRQLRVAMTALSLNPQRLRIIFSEHRQLLDALIAHDEVRARAVIDQHLRPVLEVVSRLPGFSLHPTGEV